MKTTTYTINNQNISVKLRDEADQSVAAEIFKLREYRLAEEIIASTTLPIVDVGAHSGMFTLYARALNKAARIIAIEPEPENLKLFEEHLKDNSVVNVKVIAGALAGTIGKRQLEVSPDSHNHKLTFALDDENTLTVQAYDWEHLLKLCPDGIGLMKMDIEGGEYEVFLAAKTDELAQIQALVMEYHDLPDEKHGIIEQILRENGFGVQTFPSKFDKTMGFLWATNKKNKRG